MLPMPYRDLDCEKTENYIRERTELFPVGAPLAVRELGRGPDDGDGYVNHVYRVSNEAAPSGGIRSVIVKQAKPYLRSFGAGVYPLGVERNASEVDIMRIRSAIVPQYVSRILHSDAENNLYVCEDHGDLGIVRFELIRGRRFPDFSRMIGEFMAKCNFYTSELYLDQTVFKRLECRFLSADMRLIMERILFLREPIVEDGAGQIEPDPMHRAASDFFWSRREVRVELLKLRDVYMKKRECLVHGDLHTSNILAGPAGMKVFDMEYTHMGPFSADSGYLLGNLLYTYITWFYRDEGTESQRCRYREAVLQDITDAVERYFRVFAECWRRDAKAVFRPYPEYLAGLFRTHLKEMCGFMGIQMSSRVGGFAETPDFEAVSDPHERNLARALAMTMAYNLIMERNRVESTDDILKLVRDTASSFRGRRS